MPAGRRVTHQKVHHCLVIGILDSLSLSLGVVGVACDMTFFPIDSVLLNSQHSTSSISTHTR
jgi:hypothetical protein